ncbi:hypothetical protein TNCV_3451491 [Trichonephila clavipes]|nr:hypothetical protein TNCV_3451491 [Trichonephila clavipes]
MDVEDVNVDTFEPVLPSVVYGEIVILSNIDDDEISNENVYEVMESIHFHKPFRMLESRTTTQITYLGNHWL